MLLSFNVLSQIPDNTCSSHLPILLVSSAKEPETCEQTVPDCPLICGLWSDVLVSHNPLPGLQLLHTWIPPSPMLYLQQKKQGFILSYALSQFTHRCAEINALLNPRVSLCRFTYFTFQIHLLMEKVCLCRFTSATTNTFIYNIKTTFWGRRIKKWHLFICFQCIVFIYIKHA